MATIHKRKLVSGNIVWEICHGTGANRQRFTAGKTREEAQETLNQFTRQLALHGAAPADDSLASVIGQYVAYLEVNHRPSTRRRYVRVLQTFHRRFLEPCHPTVQRLRHVTPAHIEEYKMRRVNGTLRDFVDDDGDRRDAALRRETAASPTAPTHKDNAKFGWLGRKRFKPSIAPRTINYELQVLRTFCRWAVRRNVLVVNPTSLVERLRISTRALPKFLTAEQLTRLFAACQERERRLFMTILLTGMRKGEVEHLTWADVNFDLGVIFIQEKPGWKPKTDERLIPISPTVRAILLRQHAGRQTDGLVFPNKEGHRDTHILPKLKKVGRKAGLPTVTVHALRHSFGAHLRMAGVNLADIADLLGHKDLATTQIYAKVQQEHLRGVIAKLAPIVGDGAESPPKQIRRKAEVSNTPSIRGLLKD